MASNNSYKGITIKFGADPSELSKALKDIDKEAKSTSDDIKEIEKGLKIDPKNVDLTIQKINKLGEGIQTAQKKLNTLKEAQAAAAEAMAKGAEGAEEQYKGLQREIQKTENELAKMKQQAKQTSDTVKKELTDSVTQFAGQVAKLSAVVTAVITALGGLTLSAASSADEINTLSKVTGISTEELQKFSYASDLIDVSVSTLQSSLTKLTRNMNTAKDGTGDAYEAFKALGVEIKDSGGNLRNNVDVFYEVVDALGEIDNATQRDAYAMQIFGRSAQELNPLIIAGSDALKEFGEEADSMGIIFDQQTLDNLNEFKDKVDVAKQQLKGAATIVGGELVNSFNALFDGANGLLDMVQKAKADGTLQEIADSVADAVSMLIEILSSAVKFVIKFRDAIALGVTALIAYKAAMGISNIVHALANAVKVFTAAQTEANAAAALNPYAVLAAAAVALTVAIVKLCTAQNEATEAQNRYYDSVVESVHANDEAVKKYDELSESIEKNNKAREESTSKIEAEYYGYDKLIDELYSLSAEEEKSEGTKKRMAEIVEELGGVVPELTSAFNAETGELKIQREEVEKLTEASKELRLAKAALTNQAKLDEDIAEVQLTINMLEPDLEKATAEYKNYRDETLKKWIEKLPSNFTAGMSYDEILSNLKLVSDQDAMGLGAEAVQDAAKLRQLNITMQQIRNSYDDAKNSLDGLVKKSEEYGRMIDDNREKIEEEEKAEKAAAEAELTKATEEATDATEEAAKAYEEANSKAAEYRGQLDDLISVYQKVSSGTHYSASQMSALIEKYPELSQHIRRTADGYEIEAAAVKELIDQKAQLMLAEKQEAAEQARLAYEQASMEYGRMLTYSSRGNKGLTEESKKVDEARQLWENAKSAAEAYAMAIQDYQQNSFGTSSTSGTVADLWKQSAESEIAETEHLYKMGEISAEEYYKRLADINRRYYANRAQYLEEYRKLEETVYSGMQSAGGETFRR